jgi:hypothetical protein
MGLVAGWAGYSGSADGTKSGALFNSRSRIAGDGATNLYMADFSTYIIRKIAPAGADWVVTTIQKHGVEFRGRTLDRLSAAARLMGVPFEVIVANEASSDRTAEIARGFGAVVLSTECR